LPIDGVEMFVHKFLSNLLLLINALWWGANP
jgi:hypothetical protein